MAGRDGSPPARARLAARHAARLYPGALGRLVAHELLVYADGGAGAGLAEQVVAEVLDSRPPAAPLVRSSESPRRSQRAS